jgi:hypothetical protein
MTKNQAKLLLIETVIMWDNNPQDCGTVVAINESGFFVRWDPKSTWGKLPCDGVQWFDFDRNPNLKRISIR